MSLVYLAGPITGISYEESTGWREYVHQQFKYSDIRTVSPMRGKDHLREEDSIRPSYEDHVMSSSRGVTARDRNDITRCDAVLMKLSRSTGTSVGTLIEIGWADMLRKPIVLVCDDPAITEHPIIKECCPFVTESLDEGIGVVYELIGK